MRPIVVGLLGTDGHQLASHDRRVGRAIALVEGQRSEVGFDRLGQGRFTTEVFLAAVYVVYAYTVLKLRMTREFNKVMPELPEFCRRLLGVHRRAPAR